MKHRATLPLHRTVVRQAPARGQGFKLPLLFGPMRGRYWLPFSRGKVLRLLLGTYEVDQTRIMSDMLRPGHVFYDVGAAVGYYTVLAAPRVNPTGHVVAFEPDPRNAMWLRRHVAVNRFDNVEVREMAVGNTNGRARFTDGSGTGTGRLAETGGQQVEICRLDDVVPTLGEPTHMKIDVEGAELDVLRGAERTLRRLRPTLFLSTHGPTIHEACCQFLSHVGYTLLPLSNDPKYASEILCVSQEAFQYVANAA